MVLLTVYEIIEDKQIAYVVSCKLYARLQGIIYGIKNKQATGVGIWIAEIEYKQCNWSKPRRVVVIRQQEEVRKKTTDKKLTRLFKLEDIDSDKVFKTPLSCFCYQSKFTCK